MDNDNVILNAMIAFHGICYHQTKTVPLTSIYPQIPRWISTTNLRLFEYYSSEFRFELGLVQPFQWSILRGNLNEDHDSKSIHILDSCYVSISSYNQCLHRLNDSIQTNYLLLDFKTR